ncbi:hypothetical protein CD351_05385 [Erythrobacter sp. KY5]|uniref:hypothetical protein n=1 Tax=Erythrobacter sp. KY5 TaxID=2011159 RepID=UPI000DBF2DFE|nr:hypothetical protein [Erythrobacter sp. KY5]AWW73856.1 hypothetical protein CD351_05385 [Erythrobacter sp. KY5]
MLGAWALALAACSAGPESERSAIEASILGTPGQEELWRTIMEEYPEDFAALVKEIETLDEKQRSDEAAIEAIGARWVQAFFERVAPDAVRSPPRQLLAWSKAEHALYTSLQSAAKQQCARLTMGEWITIDPDNQEATAAIARRNAAMVRAASAGRQMPSQYASPDEEDLQQFGNAIAATGLAPPLQAALGSTEQMEALPPPQQCAIGVAVYEALTALPDEDEPVMAAYMLAPE